MGRSFSISKSFKTVNKHYQERHKKHAFDKIRTIKISWGKYDKSKNTYINRWTRFGL